MVGSSPVSRYPFLDRDPVNERPRNRLRITDKRTAGKRMHDSSGNIQRVSDGKGGSFMDRDTQGMRLVRFPTFFLA